jgi:DNA modification methylase
VSGSPDNQNLAEFLARHVRHYDPAKDDYDRPPLDSDIVSAGRSEFYNLHYYPTKVPPEVIQGFVGHYTIPGDVVLDPFCGSGMTGVGCSMAGGRCAILSDLSPAACHLAANYNGPQDSTSVLRAYEGFKADIALEEDRLYTTYHYEPAHGEYSVNLPGMEVELKDRGWELVGIDSSQATTDGCAKNRLWKIPASINYVIWSDVYVCQGLATIEHFTGKTRQKGKNAGQPIVKKTKVARGCGKPIVLWDAAVNKETGEVSELFRCPHCGQEWQKLLLSFTASVPVQVNYTWKNRMGKSKREQRPVTNDDRRLIEQLENEAIAYWVPHNQVWPGRELMTMGPNRKGIRTIQDFFTKRNLRALGSLWHHIERQEPSVKQALRFIFTSQVNRASRLRRMRPLGPGEQLSGTLYVASLTVESNVFSLFDKAIANYCAMARTVPHAISQKCVICTDARSIPIPDQAIDYVFTDPPFGGNIYYADAAILWEAWLGQVTDETKELVYNRQRLKDKDFRTIEDYERGMKSAFAEMFRVLKPGRWATVEFNNSDGAVFQAIKNAIQEAGFDVANMLLFDKKLKTFKQVKGEKGEEDVVDKDVLFNLHKPAVTRAQVSPEDHDLEHQVADAVRRHLQTLPERIKAEPGKYNDEHRTTATINSMLMNTLIPKGVSVERLNLPFIERVCARYFRKVGNRWYLRGQAVGSNGGDALVEAEVVIKDEVTAIDWLRQKLHARPSLIGELKPLWMRATGLLPAALSQSLNLDFLLTENFWRDPDTNRWREPTAEERERMNDDRSLRVLHDAERYLGGTLARQTTDDERCRWIEVLYKACRDIEEKQAEALPALRGFDADEAYRVITRLFQSVLKDRVTADLFRRAEKQYKAASSKIANQLEQQQEIVKAKKKDDNQTTMDLFGEG